MPFRLLSALSACLLRAIVIAVACVSIAHAQQEQPGLFESLGKLLQPKQDAPPAETGNPSRNLAVAGQERRVALVIGNSAYVQGALVNPVNDARAIAKRLRSLGFDVVLRENLKARDIGGVYREFRSKITPGGVALVFYAGHGIQFKGQNYFPAIDADIHSEEDVPLQSLNLGNLLDNMEEAKAGVSLVFLDACRDNPFARRFRSSTRGLAKVEAASGMLIHYATRPGSVASDGEGQNGTYTEALLAQMSEPGIPVELMLKRVANQVVAKTKGKQEPWVEGSLRGDFYFIFQGPTTVNVQQAPSDPEGETWAAAQGANTVAGYQTYLDGYPKGRYAHAAKIKLTDLQRPAAIQPEKIPVIAAPTPAQVAVSSLPEYGGVQRPGTVFKDCADCPEMVVIPAGSFEMGSNTGKSSEKPLHNVRIGKSFSLGRTEVTQGQWHAVMGNNPSKFSSCGKACPVELVSWHDTKAFISKLNAKTGKNYRLPSEAEWEYACRAGGTNEYCGSDGIDAIAWYTDTSGRMTHPVAGKQPNAWGLYDMSGHLWEWVEDCWNLSYVGAPSDGSARTKGECEKRILRGGSWDDGPQAARASNRDWHGGTIRYNDVGFRVARDLSPVATLPAAAPAQVTVSSTPDDPEAAMWNEVKASGAREYLDAYLKQYPKGKYVALAKIELKKLDERDKAQRAKEATEREQAAERERQEALRIEQTAWDEAKTTGTAAAYASYVERYPKGRYAALAQVVLPKLQREEAEKERRDAAQRKLDEDRRKLAAELERREAEERARLEAARVAEQQRKAREEAARGRQWAESDNGGDINWNDATRYCASKGSGWRLPTVAELQSSSQSGTSRLTGPFFWSNESYGSSEAWYAPLGSGTRFAVRVEFRHQVRALCLRSP